MDRQSRIVWRHLILLSLWADAALTIQICAVREQSADNLCNVELSCSSYEFGGEFEWYRGIHLDQAVGSGPDSFAAKTLKVSVGSSADDTIYGCKETSSRQEAAFDVGAMCGIEKGSVSGAGPSYGKYLNVKASLTALFLALCLAVLVFTCYVCRDPTSNDQKSRMCRDLRGGEEGIYSALKEAPESGSLPARKEQAETGPTPGLSEQAETGPTPGLSEQAETGPTPGLSEQAETGTYTVLKKQDKSEDYRALKEASQGQANVTFTAQDEVVQISA